jgi:predicted DNA-binding transcriptional regulator YafY
MKLRKNGAWYTISPWNLMWDDENYYLVGYDSDTGQIRHYRVDKMLHMSITDRKREGKQAFKKFNLPQYTKSLFGMFAGTNTNVTIEGRNDMVGIMIDRFGKDIIIIPIDDTHFRTTVTVAISPQFFGWIMALGDGIKIVAPDSVVEQIRGEIERLREHYKE